MPATSTPRAPRQPRHERLTAWQAVHQLSQALFSVTLSWAPEHGAVGNELRSSVIAAGNHIVIGSYEPDAKGFRRELNAALGKLARVGCAWMLVRDLDLPGAESWGEIEAKRDHAERLTRGLYSALGRKEASLKKKA